MAPLKAQMMTISLPSQTAAGQAGNAPRDADDSRVFDTTTLRNMEAALGKMFRGGKATQPSTPLSWKHLLALIVTVTTPLATFLLVHFSPWSHTIWQERAGHTVIELFGSLMALCVAYVGLRGYLDSGSRRLLMMTLGFLTMATLDAFHVVPLPATSGSVWLRSLSGLLGGALFMAAARTRGAVQMALSPRERRLTLAKLGIYFVCLVVLGVLCVWYCRLLPTMVSGNKFSTLAIAIRWATAALLMMAVFSFLKDYRRGGGTGVFVLSLTLVLLCECMIIFGFADLMDVTWWLAHIVRLCAYLLLLVGLTLGFVNMSIQLSKVAAEQRSAEALARREQAALRSVFDSIADEMIVVDTTFTIHTVNAEAVRRHGDAAVPGFGLIGRRCFDVCHQTPQACQDCPAQEVLRAGRPVLGRMRKHGTRMGKEYTAEFNAAPVRDAAGALVGAVLMIRDVTDRENVVEALKRERDFIDRVIETADVLIVGLDLQGNITLFNRKCVELTQYAPTEVIGGPLWERLIPERFVEPVKRVFARLKADVLPSEFENPWLTRSGEECWIAWHNTNIKDAAGNVTGIIGIGVDVTDRKRAEEERGRLQDELLQVQKMNALGTLAGGLAHEFNNVLGAILGYTSLLRRKMDASHPFFKAIETIEKSSQRGAELTRQIMSFARAGQSGGGEGGLRKPTSLNDVMQRVLSLLEQTLDPKCKVETRLAKDLWAVEADSSQLVHAAMNVCINARDAMPDGGRMVIETRNLPADDAGLRAHVEARPGPYVVMTIFDTGVGMSEETQRRIFEPFFTTKTGAKGTGMGLAVAYGIVKSHQGFITVHSEVGKGACFRIHLPAAPLKAVEAARETTIAPPGGSETLLLADDEELIRTTAADMLRELGYAVHQAATGAEAVEVYRKHQDKIALVLLDMVMPGMSGGEVCSALRGINPRVIVLFSSGYALDGRAADFAAMGGRGFIRKPFEIEELANAVRELLDK